MTNRDNTITAITPDMINAEAHSFAMRAGSIFLKAMAENGISEDELAHMLEVPKAMLRNHLVGNEWRAYRPLAVLCLALEVRVDLHTTSTEPTSTQPANNNKLN